jgi:2,4-dienoyl-CoA reductase (NADPH2)
LRDDKYGGDPERRMRFPLEVVAAVREAVGNDYPVSYRFLADEYMTGGLTCVETAPFAQALDKYRPAWLSVMAGCYEAFATEQYMEDDRTEGFMAPFAGKIRQAVPGIPIVAAGRFQRVETAEAVLRDGLADLIGVGRVLLADPLWPRKVSGEVSEPIQVCEPGCTFCNDRIRAQKPSFCARWSKQRRDEFLALAGD